MVPLEIAEGAGAYPAPSVDTPMYSMYVYIYIAPPLTDDFK